MQPTNVAVLNLPKGSIFCFDGHTVALQRDDFLGITDVPAAGFHFLTVRAGSSSDAATASSVTSGFVIPPDRPIFCRKYDPYTEEVASNPVDEATEKNLLAQLQARQIHPQRAVLYQQFIPHSRVDTWKSMTNYISDALLTMRRIGRGVKLVAGSFDEDKPEVPDGQAIDYPLIPIIGEGKSTHHFSTKRFMSSLSPGERTSLFTCSQPGDKVFDIVLNNYYKGESKLILGDLQLSFVSFESLHCFASMEHWRDLLAMLSYVSKKIMDQSATFFSGLLTVVRVQMETVDLDFLDNADFSEDNFLVPAMRRLISKSFDSPNLSAAVAPLVSLLQNRFDLTFAPTQDNFDSSDDESDEDGPMVVEPLEIEQFKTRLACETQQASGTISPPVKATFPILFAAVMPNEDVVMTCARALDEAKDASLVREAAAYLEQFEATIQLE